MSFDSCIGVDQSRVSLTYDGTVQVLPPLTNSQYSPTSRSTLFLQTPIVRFRLSFPHSTLGTNRSNYRHSGFKYQAAMYMPPQYNTYGTIFWIPTQVEPTVALIGTSLPAWIQITSIAHLQFSRLWSAIQSYRRNSGSRNNHESSRDGLRHRGIPRNRDSYNQMQDSQLELRPIPSGKGPTLNIASPRAQDTV